MPNADLDRLSVGSDRLLLLGQNAEILRFDVFVGEAKTIGDKAAPEQFADGRCAAGHAAVEAPIVERRQFVLGQHDLQPFAATHCHDDPSIFAIFAAASKHAAGMFLLINTKIVIQFLLRQYPILRILRGIGIRRKLLRYQGVSWNFALRSPKPRTTLDAWQSTLRFLPRPSATEPVIAGSPQRSSLRNAICNFFCKLLIPTSW